MPELPEVQTVVDELSRVIPGHRIRSVDILRPSLIVGDTAEFQQRLQGRVIERVLRKGKYLLFALDPEAWLIAHLKMTGQFIFQSAGRALRKHDRVIFRLDGRKVLVFADIRCFGRLEGVDRIDNHPGLTALGWDPWDAGLTPESLRRRLQRTRSAIKTVLLDQTIIAGLGIIYVAEALFAARLHPQLPAHSLSRPQLKRLLDAIRKILTQALEFNGTTISDYRRVDEKQGSFQKFLKVYGKKGQKCHRCSSEIVRIVQNQRSTFLCPLCQPFSESG